MRQTWKILVALAGSIGAVEPLFAQVPAPAAAVNGDLSQAIRDARDAFRRPSPGEVAAARQGVAKASEALDRRLSSLPTGRSAKASLQLEEIAVLSAQPSSDLKRLETLARALGHKSHHVDVPELQTLETVLRRYLARLRASSERLAAEEFVSQIDRLAAAWENYRRGHDAASGARLQEICRWLEEHGQVESLCQRLRREISHANHRMHVSAGYLQQSLTQDVVQPISSDEMQEGAHVHVAGQIKGKVTPTLVPNAQAGAVAVHFAGVGDSQIVANKGRVTVQARGITNIQATEVAYLTEKGVSTSAPRVDVQHRSIPYAAGVAARTRLVQRLGSAIVMRVLQRKQAESDWKTSRDTQRKVDAEVRRQSAKLVQEANGIARQYGIFDLLGPQPDKTLKINTTAERIQWLGHYASTSQFAAATPAPAIETPNPAVLVQLHESALNNSENWLADRTISDSDFRELVFDTFGLVPAGQDAQTAQIPATITFADEQPLEVRIDEGRVDVTLRLKAFSCQGATFDDRIWTVRTAYAPQLSRGGFDVVRVAPISVEAESSESVGQLQTILSRFLVEKASSIASANQKPSSLPPLDVAQLKLKQGWLSVALVVRPKSVAAKAPVTGRS